ncbi:nucleotidyltransferase family protein [Thioclava sp. BHET1]|nr:nucleotidyltransferase family protein [Thioclava sp. BHET1]
MRDTPRSLMLFAAGFGTRMGALTQDRPKPLVEVAGKPLVDHALALVHEAGIAKVVANVHYRADQMEAYLAPRGVEISDERAEILETGGGLRKALPQLGTGPVFTLNTDAVWTGDNVITTLQAAWDSERMDALVALVPPEQALGHTGAGDFAMAPDGSLTRGTGYIYTGAQILVTDGLAEIAEDHFSLNRLWDQMIARGRLYGVVHRGGWCDVGRPNSISLAEGMLEGAAR